MKIIEWERFKKLRGLLATDQPEPEQQAERIVRVLRDVVLPAKAGLSIVVIYYLHGWLYDEKNMTSVVMDYFKNYFLIYLLCNFAGALLFISWRRLPPGLIQWLAFTLGLLDGVFMAGMTMVTGGFASIAFWVFPGLVVLNALSIPLATPQIVLNLLLSMFYMSAVLLTPNMDTLPDPQALANMVSMYSHAPRVGTDFTNQPVQGGTMMLSSNQLLRNETLTKLSKAVRKSRAAQDNGEEDILTGQLLQRVSVLWLLTLCCYGAQVLSERQRQAILEAAEFAAREGQLHSAGRLAAEFAHQIKNPLAIINNAAYSLQRSLRENKNSAAQQIEIIQEEVARADKVITQIMGYAQLSEGRVERLNLAEELERACDQVFPGAVPSGVKVKKRLTGPFPPLLMQRIHLSEILVNLLLNARDVLAGQGNLVITASCHRDQVVEVSVADNGPGIPPDKIEKIFEAYFTTKDKGTGLGLAIVKHNVELYGGSVKVESVLGKGATFTVTLPPKSKPKPFIK